MIATMRGACLVGVLVIVIGCLAETRAYVSFDQVNPGNSSVSDDDLLKSAVPEQEAKAETEKPKLTRVPLEPRKYRRAIDGSLATINENDGEKPRRVAIKERPVPKDIAPEARPGAKRNHKKMKLAQTQSQKKSKKTKRYVDTAAKQQLFGNQNRSETVRANRHKDEKYYAPRKAIMDRFHTRNREIVRKYQQRAIKTTMTTTTEGPKKYNLGLRDSSGSRTKAASSPTTTEDDGELPRKSETPTRTRSTTPKATITKRKTTPTTERSEPRHGKKQGVGNCDNLESLYEVYQHNLVLDIQKNTVVEAEVYPPQVEGASVACVITHQISGPSQKINVSKDSMVSNVRVEGTEDGPITIAVKFYTTSNRDGHS